MNFDQIDRFFYYILQPTKSLRRIMNNEEIEQRIQEITEELTSLRLQLELNRTGRHDRSTGARQPDIQTSARTGEGGQSHPYTESRTSTGFQDSAGRTIYLGDPVMYRPHNTRSNSRRRQVGYVHRNRGSGTFIYIRPQLQSPLDEVYRAPHCVTLTQHANQDDAQQRGQ